MVDEAGYGGRRSGTLEPQRLRSGSSLHVKAAELLTLTVAVLGAGAAAALLWARSRRSAQSGAGQGDSIEPGSIPGTAKDIRVGPGVRS